MPVGKGLHIRTDKALFRYLVVFLVALSFACSIPLISGDEPTVPEYTPTPITPPTPTPTPEPLPPGLVESDPPIGGVIPLLGPITMYFNQPMDRASVESELNTEFKDNATFTWTDDRTIVIHLSNPLEPDTELSFNLGDQALSTQNLGMMHPVSLNYRTSGYLSLTQMLPENETIGIDPSSAVIAAFNRPVVPLGEDPGTLPAAFTLSPTALGRGEWINTSTYAFYPDPPLTGGQRYTIAANPDLTSVDGGPLQESAAWNFTTAAPRLISISPYTEMLWPLDPDVELTFNQPMAAESVQANFSLQDPNGEGVAGSWEWNEDSTVFTFSPTSDLERNTEYMFYLDGDVRSLGGTALGEDWQINITTFPDLFVYQTDPGSGGELASFGNFTIYFSTPVDEDEALENIQISPLVDNLYANWNPNAYAINLRADFAPSSAYTLSISPQLTDIWGDELDTEYRVSFRTGPLRPNFIIQTPSQASFLTPQDEGIIAQVANISEIPISRGAMTLSDFFSMTGPDGYEFSQTYQSMDQVSWVQRLDINPDVTQPLTIPVDPHGEPLSPGLYAMRINLEAYDKHALTHILVVSDIHMLYKISSTDTLVWAVDLKSGEPLKDAPVSLYDELGNRIVSGRTDEQGLFYSQIPPIEDTYGSTYAVISQPGEEDFSLAMSNWSQGIQPWDFDIRFSSRPPGTMVYFYTDRPIYRPGQTVYYRAVVRNAHNGRYELPDIARLPVEISNDQGKLAEIDLSLSTFGSTHSSFTLPDDATPGYYQIRSPDLQNSSVSFQVANYRKPEINLSVEFSDEDIQAGEELHALINARFFFDAPAGNVPVKWTLHAIDSHFRIPGYRVGPLNTDWMSAFRFPDYGGMFGVPIDEGDGETNPDGTLPLVFSTEAVDRVQNYILEVTLVDESGFPVSARAESDVHPAEFYIGVRPDAWVGKSGTSMNFEVLTTDWAAQPLGSRNLRADFQKVVWERIDPDPDEEYLGPEFVPNYTLVGSSDFTTNSEALARLSFVPPEAGTYQLSVYDPISSEGEGARTDVLTWISGPTGAVWPRLPNARLRLTTDQDAYQPGDTSQVFIPNPWGEDAIALVTIERGVIMESQVLDIPPQGYQFSLPLSPEDAPNVYISTTLLGSTQAGEPDFRHGLAQVGVEPSHQTLSVRLTSQPERTGPGDEVTFEILVTDSTGEPVQGEFSLAVVDQAVLALADPNSPEITEAFYGIQPLGVRTGLSLAAYSNRKFYFPLGLGGGGDGAQAPSVARQDFPDTAFWEAEVVTDAQGKAQVTLNLPDTLTTWEIDSRGMTQDTLVGQARSEVVTTKELLVRPVTPRFLVVGDRIQLAAVVQNNTDKELQVETNLEANGLLLEDPDPVSINLPAGGRSRIEWLGAAQDVPSANLVFSVYGQDADGNTYSDAAQPALGALPILHYTAPRSFRTSGTLDEGGDILELVSLPVSFDPKDGEFSLELAPSLGAAMVNALEVLETQPYHSTETVISRFLPNLESYRVLSRYGIDSVPLKTRLDRTLNDGLQRLQAQQNPDGGWGWWSGGKSDSYITAYALFGLLRAQEAGVNVNPEMLESAVGFLQANLDIPSEILETWQLDRLAFEHFALTNYGAGDLGATEALYQYEHRLSPWAQSLLALSLEDLSPGNPTSQAILSDLGTAVNRSATGAHWEFSQDPEGRTAAFANMHNTLSNSAVVVYAMAQRDPGAPLLAEALRYLMAHRQADKSWGASYHTAWTLMALTEVVAGTGELGGDFNYSAEMNKNTIAEGTAGGAEQLTPVTVQLPIQRLYPDYPNTLLIQRSPGQGRLYYSAGLQVSQPVDQVAPLSQGVSIERHYYPAGDACPDNECEPVNSARAGEKITVRLTLSLPQDVYYLAVEDYIPAGTEILDTRLKTTQLGEYEEPGVEVLYDPRNPYAKGWGWWLFNPEQIYDDHITWTADFLPAGTYELTYTLVTTHAGSFQTIPARTWQLYFPEVQANTPGEVFEIKP